MTHPPSGPSQPPRPSGPREDIPQLDPDSDAGRQAADELSEVLARAWLRIQRRNNSSKRHGTDAA